MASKAAAALALCLGALLQTLPTCAFPSLFTEDELITSEGTSLMQIGMSKPMPYMYVVDKGAKDETEEQKQDTTVLDTTAKEEAGIAGSDS